MAYWDQTQGYLDRIGKMRSKRKDRLIELYEQYMQDMYGGKGFLTSSEEQLFGEQEKLLASEEERLTGRELELGARRGVLRSGVWEKGMAERVTGPMTTARGALSLSRLQAITGEKTRRHGEGMSIAMGRLAEEKERSGRFGKFLGKVVGGGAMGALTGLTGGLALPGILAAGGIGALGSVASGGGTQTQLSPAAAGLTYDDYLKIYRMLLEKLGIEELTGSQGSGQSYDYGEQPSVYD